MSETEEQPIFSFLVPTYQSPERLRTLLAQVVGIARGPCEILVSLTESDTYNSLNHQIIDEYNATAILLPPTSVASAINALAISANGRYLIPLGDDTEIDMEASSMLLVDVVAASDMYKDDVFCLFGKDNEQNKRKPIVPKRVVDLLGYMYCPIFRDTKWCDYWLGSVISYLERMTTTDAYSIIVRPELADPVWFSASHEKDRIEESLIYQHTASVRTQAAAFLAGHLIQRKRA